MEEESNTSCFQSHSFQALTFQIFPLRQDEAWAAGGSGILLRTTNGGRTWIRDKAADNIAANLYSVK